MLAPSLFQHDIFGCKQQPKIALLPPDAVVPTDQTSLHQLVSLLKALSMRHHPLVHPRKLPQAHQQKPVFIHNTKLAVLVMRLLTAGQQALQAVTPGVDSKVLLAHLFSGRLC